MERLRGKLTFANVVACTALFVALGGVGYAATRLPANSVGTAQIRKGAVTPAKLSKRVHLASTAPTVAEVGPAGPQGPAGERGPAGAAADPTALERRLAALEEENAGLAETVDHLTSTLAGVKREGTTLVFEGMNLQLLNGHADDHETNGLGNLIVGHNLNPGAQTGSANIVIGSSEQSFTSVDGIIGGADNTVSGEYVLVTSVGGTASGDSSQLIGGLFPKATQYAATVVNGYGSEANGSYATVLGGRQGKASGMFSVEAAGLESEATAPFSFARGGHHQVAATEYATVP